MKRAKLCGDSAHIRWDEATIAEHDKERGTRMKIDEPPTPYRYVDDDAYCSEYSSNGISNLNMEDDNSANDEQLDVKNPQYMVCSASPDTHKQSAPVEYASSPPAQVGDNVMDVWESLRAKLIYEQQKQQQEDKEIEKRQHGQQEQRTAVQQEVNGNMNLEAEDDEQGDRSFEVQHIDADDYREPAPPTQAFINKRSAHYNEFQLMQAMRKRMQEEDEDD